MANSVVLQTLAPSAGLVSSAERLRDCSPGSETMCLRNELRIVKAHYSDKIGSSGIQLRRSSSSPCPVLKAAGRFPDSVDDSSFSSSAGLESEDEFTVDSPIRWSTAPEMQQEGIVLSSAKGSKLQRLTQDVAMGLVLHEGAGTSWTTGSGLEGPAGGAEPESKEELKFPDLSKSPRRKMRVAFTCNVCGERTIRAMNPLAYTDGTVFVQCKGCNVFHKLVDNLNLFHEMKGKIYRGYDIPWYANDQPYNFFDNQYPLL